MKVALVHDWLYDVHGGAERVFLRLSELFPDSDVYTLLFNEDRYSEKFDPLRVHTSFLQSFPKRMKDNKKYLLPFIRPAIEEWSFKDYDLVISSSGAWSKNISTPETMHICYCHTPARFLWDYEEQYIQELDKGRVVNYLVRKINNHLKSWDKETKGVNEFIANSKTVQRRIRTYYERESAVIYPPVEVDKIQPESNKADYYITLSTLTPYKKIDLVVNAFNETKKKLIVIGDGPERKKLESLANDNITFAGFVSEYKKIRLLQKARGLIFPNEEDFGIAPVESLAAGTPVIGFNKGGVAETVTNNKTGVLFDQQNETDILKAIKAAENQNFSASRLHDAAEQYSTEHFENELLSFIRNAKQR